MFKQNTSKSGFTLLELLIVVIIVSILAAVALPQFTKITEKSRAAEGVMILGAIRTAHLAYYLEHGVYRQEGPWNDPNGLDVDISTPKYFIWCPTSPSEGFAPGAVARVKREVPLTSPFGQYNLKITPEGKIYCWGGNPGACKALGFEEQAP